MKINELYCLFAIPLGFWFTRIYGILLLTVFTISSTTAISSSPETDKVFDNLTFGTLSNVGSSTISLACPANQIVNCAEDIVTPNPLDASASTTCSDDIVLVTVNGPNLSGPANCPGTRYNYVFTAEDNCGAIISCTQSFTLTENVSIGITCPAPTTVACAADINPNIGLATVTVSCGLPFIHDIEGPIINGTPNCPGTTYLYRYRVGDDCNRSVACDHLFIIDDTPAAISCPSDMNVNCADDINIDVNLVNYTSPCGQASNIQVSNPIINGDPNCPGTTYTFTYSAVDNCGIRAICDQTFTITGGGASTFCPGNVTIDCSESTDPANTGMASGSNACGLGVAVDYIDNIIPGACPQSRIIERTWTFTDVCGDMSFCTAQVITIEDNTAPIAPMAPANTTVQCLQDIPSKEALSAMDDCAGLITVLPVDDIQQGACATRFTVLRTWTFDDGCNATTINQTITVVDDQAISILSTGNDQTVSCSYNAIAQPYLVEVYTPCESETEIEAQGPEIIGTPNCPGTQVIWTYIASDDCGRSATATQTYIIDNEGPQFVCPPDICILDCDFSTDAIQNGFDDFANVATVTTSCNGLEPTITNDFNPNGFINQNCSDGPIAIENTKAYQIVTFTATDPCGRSTNCTALVVLVDHIAPEIEGTINNEIVECDDNVLLYFGKWTAANLNKLSATDACGEVTWSFDPLAPELECSAVMTTTTVNFIATDQCGNSSWVSADFSIKNKFPAMFNSSLENKTIACGDIPVFDTPTYVHGCGETELSFEDITSPGDCGGISAISRIWTVTDICNGETGTTEQTIYFEGSASVQFIQVPEDKTITCNESFDFDAPICVSSCEAYTMQSEDEEEFICGGSESLTRTWVVINECGDPISCAQTITIVDEEPPIFVTFPDDIISVCEEVFDYGTPEIDDNCGQAGLIYTDEMEGNCYDGLTITRIWSATDGCGNSTSQIQIIELLPVENTNETSEREDPIFDDRLHIYPNPAAHMINLKYRLQNLALVSTSIYDLQGNVMNHFEEEVPAGEKKEQIDISNYPDGTYIVIVEHNGVWLSSQFVKVIN